VLHHVDTRTLKIAVFQVRLPNGESMTQSFQVREQLSAVRLYVQLNRKDGDTTPFTFKTTFPSRVFSNVDMEATLQGLGKNILFFKDIYPA